MAATRDNCATSAASLVYFMVIVKGLVEKGLKQLDENRSALRRSSSYIIYICATAPHS